MRPSCCTNLSRKRGSGECRVRAAPAVSCAKLCENTHTSIQVQRKHSGIPRAMALRLMARSPRRRIRLVTVAAGLMAGRSGRIAFATGSLTPATGAGTTRFCRTRRRRSSCALLFTHDGSPCEQTCAPALPRPPHPAPTFVTMANAPCLRTGRGIFRFDLPDAPSGIFLAAGLDRARA
jgi:hypothetical protein